MWSIEEMVSLRSAQCDATVITSPPSHARRIDGGIGLGDTSRNTQPQGEVRDETVVCDRVYFEWRKTSGV